MGSVRLDDGVSTFEVDAKNKARAERMMSDGLAFAARAAASTAAAMSGLRRAP